jgi:hypothetical protein
LHPQLSNNRHPLDGALVGGVVRQVEWLQTTHKFAIMNKGCGLAIYIKKYLKAKDYGNSKFSPCKNTIFKKILTIYQN